MDERNFIKVKAIAFEIVNCIYDTLKDIPQEYSYNFITVPKYFDEYDTIISFSKSKNIDGHFIYNVKIGDEVLSYSNIELGLKTNNRFQRQLLDVVNSEKFIYDELYTLSLKHMQEDIMEKQKQFFIEKEFNAKIKAMLEGRE